MNSVDFVLNVATVILSVLGSWATALHVSKRGRLNSAEVGAIEQLLPAIARLRALMHASSARSVEPGEVGSAVVEFEELFLQHGSVLPARVQPIKREVLAAVGNYFGGSSLAGISAEFLEYPLAEPDPYWQDISMSYVEYALRELKLSASGPKGKRMLYFHEWRKDEDSVYHAARE